MIESFFNLPFNLNWHRFLRIGVAVAPRRSRRRRRRSSRHRRRRRPPGCAYVVDVCVAAAEIGPGPAPAPAPTPAPGPVPGLAPGPGRAVQVDPIKPTLKAPGGERLKPKYDDVLSNLGVNFNLRRYTLAAPPLPRPPPSHDRLAVLQVRRRRPIQ